MVLYDGNISVGQDNVGWGALSEVVDCIASSAIFCGGDRRANTQQARRVDTIMNRQLIPFIIDT